MIRKLSTKFSLILNQANPLSNNLAHVLEWQPIYSSSICIQINLSGIVLVPKYISITKNDMHTKILKWQPFRPRPHVSVFVWKRTFFFADCLSVHTYPANTVNENDTFRKLFPEWKFLKMPFTSACMDEWKRNFSETLPRVEIFENAVYQRSYGWMETELFRSGYVMVWCDIQIGGRIYYFCAVFPWPSIKPKSVSWDQLGFAEYSRWLRL